jgi:hypothetical protein
MRSLVAALLAIVTLVPALDAQGHPQTREGFWISFGFGYGSLGCNDCDSEDRISGGSAYLRMGGTLGQRLLIGGEANAWSRTEGNVEVSIANIGPVLIFYPAADGGLYLKAGAGLASAEVQWGNVTGEQTGAGITLGIGYDARVARGFALTPYFDIAVSNFDNASFNRYSFGLGFTWP